MKGLGGKKLMEEMLATDTSVKSSGFVTQRGLDLTMGTNGHGNQ